MANEVNFPQFPYSGNQIILSSDRVVLHSKKDAIFLFGKAAVGLSSTKTINLEAKEAIHISSPKVYLGPVYSPGELSTDYQPTVLGNNLSEELLDLYTYLSSVAFLLSKVNESNLATWAPSMRYAAEILNSELNKKIINIKNGNLKSKNAYVK